MDELNLDPYAVTEHWKLPNVGERWELLLAKYLQTLAVRCMQADKAVIGHIKAMALFPDGTYFRISVVDTINPASSEGEIPPSTTELKLVLNVLVYGLSRKQIQKINEQTANEIAHWNGSVEFKYEQEDAK